MFQNVINQSQEEIENEPTRKIQIKNLFKINDIVLYAVAFLISMVGFNKELAPFGLAIFAAASSNRIPVGILYVAVLIRYSNRFWRRWNIIISYKLITVYSNDSNF